MILFTEKIAPPPPIIAEVPDKEARRKRKLADALVQEDRWVKKLIDGLAGVLRDAKH